jgi:ribosomal protein S18 acetylase RimI-like enzyme
MSKIIFFDELKDDYQFLRLMDSAFGFTWHPQDIIKRRKADERYKYPFGFCLMKGKTLAGFVGVMDIPVKTIDGKTEKVGGIHSVATHPMYIHQGIASVLMDVAHNHFQKLGYRFSFLCTSKSLVAYSLYEKLGYKDFTSLNKLFRAYKIFPKRGQREEKKITKQIKADFQLIEDFYCRATANRTGFATRIKNWGKSMTITKRIIPQNIFVEKDGYAFITTGGGVTYIIEFIANTAKTYLTILNRIKKLHSQILIDSYFDDKRRVRIYQEQGFVFRQGTYFSFMYKPLTNVSFEQMFGNKFYLSALDTF